MNPEAQLQDLQGHCDRAYILRDYTMTREPYSRFRAKGQPIRNDDWFNDVAELWQDIEEEESITGVAELARAMAKWRRDGRIIPAVEAALCVMLEVVPGASSISDEMWGSSD